MRQKLLKNKINERLIYLYFVFPNQPSSQKNNKCFSHEKNPVGGATLPYLPCSRPPQEHTTNPSILRSWQPSQS
jgi:hypothetical protein